jgi:hypothetical protein
MQQGLTKELRLEGARLMCKIAAELFRTLDPLHKLAIECERIIKKCCREDDVDTWLRNPKPINALRTQLKAEVCTQPRWQANDMEQARLRGHRGLQRVPRLVLYVFIACKAALGARPLAAYYTATVTEASRDDVDTNLSRARKTIFPDPKHRGWLRRPLEIYPPRTDTREKARALVAALHPWIDASGYPQAERELRRKEDLRRQSWRAVLGILETCGRSPEEVCAHLVPHQHALADGDDPGKLLGLRWSNVWEEIKAPSDEEGRAVWMKAVPCFPPRVMNAPDACAEDAENAGDECPRLVAALEAFDRCAKDAELAAADRDAARGRMLARDQMPEPLRALVDDFRAHIEELIRLNKDKEPK